MLRKMHKCHHCGAFFYEYQVPCEFCGGAGISDDGKDMCPVCRGEGLVVERWDCPECYEEYLEEVENEWR